VPSDGTSRSLRALLDRLDEHSIDSEEFSVHTPDLDDVFLALTGHSATDVGGSAGSAASTESSVITDSSTRTDSIEEK
jgi:hypothetical protein